MSHSKLYFTLGVLLWVPLSVLAQADNKVSNQFDRAVEQYQEGDYKQSKNLFEAITPELCADNNLARECIDAKTYLADIARVNREFEMAEKRLAEAEHILEQNFGIPHPIQMKVNLQRVYLNVDKTDFESAKDVVNSSLALTDRPEMEGLPRARGYLSSAYLESELGNYHKSLVSYSKALDALEDLERDRDVLRFLALAYNNMGLLTRRIGDLHEAMDYFLDAMDVTKTLYGENHPEVGLVHNNIGTIYYFMGDYGQAADYFLSTADIYKENYGENNERVAGAYNNTGVVYTEMGEISKAAEILEKAQRIKEKLLGENHIDTAIGYSNLGSIYMENENYDAAMQNFQKSIEIRKNIYGNNHPNLISPYINLGDLYTKIKQFDKARENFNLALEITEERLGNLHPNVWDIRINIGDTFEQEKYFKTALENYQQAYNLIVKESGYHPNGKSALSSVSHPLLFMSAAAKAGNMHIKLYEQEGAVVHLHEAVDNYSTAKKVIDFLQRSYQNEASKLNLIDQNYSIFTNTIKAYKYLSEETGDDTWLDEILTVSELSRSRIALELLQDLEAKEFAGVPQNVLQQEASMNKKIAEYYQQLHAEQEKGFEANQKLISSFRDSLFESRQTLNSLTERLERNYPEYFKLKYSQNFADRKTISALLDPNELMISYIVSDEDIFALALSENEIEFYSLGSSDSLSTHIKSLRSAVLSDQSERYTTLAHNLYNQLLEPILSDFKAHSLTILPDQALHYVPFEMLLTDPYGGSDYHDYSYLIREYEVSYASSATVMEMLADEKESNPQNLFAAAPFYDAVARIEPRANSANYMAGLSPLPLTRYETAEISKIFEEPQTLIEYIFPEQVTLLQGKEATKSAVESISFQDYGFIHFATHAFVNEQDPSLSGIAFWGEKEDDGVIYVNDIYNMNMPADLIVLGACETGLGTVYKGEGIIGFTRAFIYAGASNLMVSMWKVNDQPTATLMIQFYKYVKNGLSYPEALRKAKMDLIGQPEFAAPRNWAAFVLQGR